MGKRRLRHPDAVLVEMKGKADAVIHNRWVPDYGYVLVLKKYEQKSVRELPPGTSITQARIERDIAMREGNYDTAWLIQKRM